MAISIGLERPAQLARVRHIAHALAGRVSRLELAWVVFALVVSASIPFVGRWLPIPFHLVWVSLALVYGYVVWSVITTAIVLVAVSALTGGTLVWAVLVNPDDVHELTEVPLMAIIFSAMFWHVQRRQRAMEEVRKSRERERDFVRDASHQLRTPIAVAQGHAELLRIEVEGEAAEDLAVIEGELRRLAKLSDRLLVLAASEHEGFLCRTETSFEDLVLETGRRWAAAADRRWAASILAEGTIRADAEQLAAAFDAVIENAVKFTEAGDRITIVADAVGSTALVRITDTGAGIPSNQLSRVFERFSRASMGEGLRGGTGLGLPIVKAIVEAHRGKVSIASEPGVSTSVLIELPSFEPAPAPVRARRPLVGMR